MTGRVLSPSLPAGIELAGKRPRYCALLLHRFCAAPRCCAGHADGAVANDNHAQRTLGQGAPCAARRYSAVRSRLRRRRAASAIFFRFLIDGFM